MVTSDTGTTHRIVDLTGAAGLLDELLYEPESWRVRATERIDLSSAMWAERRRSVEVLPIRRVLKGFTREDVPDGAEYARLYLPVGSFRLGAPVDFSLTVNGKRAYLLPHSSQSKVESRFLSFIAIKEDLFIDEELLALIHCICGFTSQQWISAPRWRNERDLERVFLAYLQPTLDALQIDVNQRLTTVQEWKRRADLVGNTVRGFTSTDENSAAENPILAIPQLLKIARTEVNSEKIDSLLKRLNELLGASALAKNGRGGRLVRTYSDYGHHWDAVAECNIPLDEHFLIETADKTALGSDTFDGTARQLVVVGDARSNHVNFRVCDPHVELAPNKRKVFTEKGEERLFRPSVTQDTPELLALHFSESQPRDYRLRLALPLIVSPLRRFVNVTIATIVAGAFILLLVLRCVSNISASDISVLLVPSAIAASLLLVRESSTLVMAVNGRYTKWLIGVLILLWALVAGIYIFKWFNPQSDSPPPANNPPSACTTVPNRYRFVQNTTSIEHCRDVGEKF